MMMHFVSPCYLFGRKPIGRVGSDTFTLKGFTSWKKVNGGKHCPFVIHECSSTKRNDQLQNAQLAEISHLAEIGELEGGRGSNQLQNIQKAGDTRWSLHFKSICSLLRLFGPTRVLCRALQITEKSEMYPLIDRLVHLILTLPVSTATSERAFSKMKLVKARLRSTMSDDFLKSSMILSIEREIVGTLWTEKMIDDFYCISQRRVQMMKKRKVSS
ncbi:hypothetical protein CTI12_AA183140 [Artemisia annua]|uniref:HAT C-terminal dimerisation domain-containing protein n=1 Tax=Artemisia annua TaxID=35608 RepID=A0A2U1P0Z8_ARTAN|nr:hypothetical protein CTI12_AA183140 [Artemisia annua]